MKQKSQQKEPNKGEIVIYKDKKGHAKLEVNLQNETVWLSQAQMAKLFDVERSVVTKHVRNVFNSGELNEKSNVQKMHIANSDKPVSFFSLDVIISIGYRVNSKRATQFRVWATNILKQYLLRGYVLNQKRLQEKKEHNLTELENAIHLLQDTIKSKQLDQSEADGLLHVITEYTNSWVLLQKYDEGKIEIRKKKIGQISVLNYEEATIAVSKLKLNLLKKKEATDLFGQEKAHGLEGIMGSINQTFGGKQLYPSIEEKAAHVLYFVIKDHPFVDGNKRSASLLFILFLQRNNYLVNKKGEKKINDNALVALALLIAQSKPQEKDTMIALITNLLQ